MKRHLIYITLSLALAAACSKSGGGGGSGKKAPSKTTEPLEVEMYGTYQAIFAPLNKEVSGHLNGSLTLVRERDEFVADVRLASAPASILHTQTIHVGSRCPEEKDDLNFDGFVDGEEAALVHKGVLIPLDDDLSSQRMGLGTYPVADQYGQYFWSRATSFEKLMEDLREEDINHTDEYVKLGSEKSLTVSNKVVIIRGVPETTPLPETVKGVGRLNKYQALPVACGVIRKLTKVPGVIDPDITKIPVPTGESVGGSSGADDGADFGPATPTTTGGNYGEEDEEDEVITHSNEVDPQP